MDEDKTLLMGDDTRVLLTWKDVAIMKPAGNRVPAPQEPPPDLSGLWKQPQTMPRITWDSYFMEIAQVTAKRSTCPRKNVGAVIVKDNRILATGYNGAPRGSKHCIEVGCHIQVVDGDEGCSRTVHAEANAIMQSHDRDGATLYCTHVPCRDCALLIANSGIIKVVFDLHSKKQEDTQLIFEETNVHMVKHLK